MANRPKHHLLAPIAAALVAVLVGFSGSAIIVYQAALTMGATTEQFASWIWALGVGMALLSFGLSWIYKNPVIFAWSTPGAALLASSLVQVPLAQAIGAFMFSALLIFLVGMTGWFERAMKKIPQPIGAALLVGVLFKFGVQAVTAVQTQAALVLAMFVTYLVVRRLAPRYAVIAVLVVGMLLASQMGMLPLHEVQLIFATPQFVMPEFSWPALVGIGFPLFIVTMTSQNMPGVAISRASGYDTPVSPIIASSGVVTFLLAPFGGFALNLAAITAAICMGPDAHADPKQRYKAGMAYGVLNLLVAIIGASVATLFSVFPKELVFALAGIALIGTIANGLTMATADVKTREAAVVTFLVTASGMTGLGIGSAFWGIVAGLTVLSFQRFRTGAH